MTVSTITIKNSYSGNGSATAFAYTFKIFASAELKVYIRTEADGTETLKTVTTHYTVSGIGDTGGGTVTFTAGNVPTSAQQVLLTRDSPLTQSTDYVENDPFPASSHEDALDKLTHQMQEQQEELDRSFKVSKTVTDLTSSEVVDDAATRASKILGFSTNGASFAYYDNASTDVEVSSIAGLTSAANKMIRYTGSGTADLIDFLDQDDMSGNSASAVPSQQSVVAYVAAQITAEDLDVTSDSGTIAIDLNSETLTVAGGTGLASAATSNTVTLNIDSTVATLAGTQTLTNKTLTSPKINDTTAITSTGAELNILDGVTSTAAELNILDGVTSTAAELNILDGVTSTAAELNILDGVTSTTAELNILDGVTSTTAELNILDGVTATATELNLIDGVTATTAELNILDGVTSTAAELNILDGVTSTAAELNILDGATVVVGEINALDIGATAIGTAVASKAIILDANKDYTGVRNFTISGELDAATLDISGNIDVDGTTNLDAVDIDGAVQLDSTLTVGVNDTGYDVKLFGSTSGAYMLWDESADDLKLVGAAGLTVATTALVTGVLTTTATQVATGGITSGSDIISDTDSTDDLGTTGVRWANLFVDAITATDQITATGFTGTLDGILGSGAAAAATVTTLTASSTGLVTGILSLGSVGATGGTAGEVYFGGVGGSVNGFRIHNKSGNALTFANASATLMTIKDSGAVGVATTAPTEKLTVHGAIRSTAASADFTAGAPGVMMDSPNGAYARIGTVSGTGTGGYVMFMENNGEKMRITGGKVGIGTTAPASLLHLSANQPELTLGWAANYSGQILFKEGTTLTGAITMHSPTDTVNDVLTGNQQDGNMVLGTGASGAAGEALVLVTNGVQRMIFEGAGAVGIGVANPTAAFEVGGAQILLTQAGNTVLGTTNTTGTVSGSVQALSNQSVRLGSTTSYPTEIVANNVVKLAVTVAGTVNPGSDNAQAFGAAGTRWTALYAVNGTIQTSDAREKTAVRSFSDAEITAAKLISKEIGIFQWLTAVDLKGADAARLHTGLTVQKAVEIMTAQGLDPMAYGFICYDEWEDEFIHHPARAAVEEVVVDGVITVEAVEAQTEKPSVQTKTAGNRYSFRYDQLNLFIARGIEDRLAALEA